MSDQTFTKYDPVSKLGYEARLKDNGDGSYSEQLIVAPLVPVGSHGSNSSLSSAVALTPPTGATKLILQALAKNVRLTLDGTTPTASVGFRITADSDPVQLDVPAGATIKVIEEAASATIQYQWGH